MRSWGWLMRKFSSERSVCAPQYLSAGTWIWPKASLSVRAAEPLEAIAAGLTCKNRVVGWANVLGVRTDGREALRVGVTPWAELIGAVLELAEHVLRALVVVLG
jgi:hypothetical protein